MSRLRSPSDKSLEGRAASLTRFAAVMARRNAVLHDTHLDSACAKGSEGGLHRGSSTMGRSQDGVLRALGGCNLKSPLQEEGHQAMAPTVAVP